jgi:pilus assembly protein CpaE
MTPLLRAVVVDSDPDSRAALRRMLAGLPSVILVGEFGDLRGARLEAPALRPDLLVVETPRHAELNGGGPPPDAIGALAQALPDAAILATGPTTSAEFVIGVMRAGALDLLRRPVDRAELAAAVDKIVRLRRGRTAPTRAGHLTAAYATKGGLGVTTVATSLAVCLAEGAPDGALLVDLDTRQSDVATFLDLRPKYSVLDAFGGVDRMDEAFLRSLLVRHASGLWVLPGPLRMERGQLSGEQTKAGLEIIRSRFDHVVLDLRHDVDPTTVAALETADVVLFLVGLSVSALRSGAAGLAAFRQLGLDLDRVRVVVMREDTGGDVSLKQVREVLGLPVYWRTPSDYPTALAAVNGGQPVVTASPRSKLAKNLRQLAQAVAALHEGARTPASRVPEGVGNPAGV